MDLFRRTELNELFDHQAEPCLSIYLRTHRTGRDMDQDPIRFKNLLREAEEKLTEWGLRAPDARTMLEDASQLQGDTEFWRHLSDGLAMFFAPGFHRRYRLPVPVDESIHVGKQFYVQPLLPLLHGNGAFYILALSQKKIRLYRAGRYSLDELELEGVPRNLEEALQHEDLQTHLTHRSWGTRASNTRRAKQSLGAPGGGSVVFHGQGSDEDPHKKDLAEFFQQIDDGVTRKLHDEHAPLILACVDYEAPIYRAHNHYGNLLEAVIAGNPEQWSNDELHRRAWELVEPHLRKAQDDELNKFNKLPADRISTDLKSIAEAAEIGRVEALFIPRNGNGNGSTRRAQTSPKDEMLEIAAGAVLRTGGDVFALPPDAMPPNAPEAAAVFRYALPTP